MGRLALLVLISPFLIGSSSVAASCPTNGLTLTDGQWLMVDGDCTVDGNITLSGFSVLIVADAQFVLRGNLVAKDNAIVSVQRTQFTIDNEVNYQWTMNLSGAALLWFNRTVFRASQDPAGSHITLVQGRDTSNLWITDSSLSAEHSWLLSRFVDSAKVTLSNSLNFPSEISVENQASARLEAGSVTALWMPFDAGSRATILLPDQTAGRYSFEFGRRTPNVVGIGYDVVIQDSMVRLGVNSKPLSQLTVVGRGKGAAATGSGELSIGYSLAGVLAPQTITGLRPGYQANTRLTHQGRVLTLYNVEVDPVGWSVWVSGGIALVTIRDSILNEVAAWSAKVEVQDSILQWAVLGSTGAGTRVVVRDSNIFAQQLFATSGGRIEVRDSTVHGSPIVATDGSSVQVTSSLLSPSGSVDSCGLLTGLTPSGVPLCSPFVVPGVLPTVTTVGTGQVVIDGPPPAATTDLHLVGWSDPQVASLGGLFTYHAQVGNAGPDPATNVLVRLRTPPQAVVDSFSPTCALSGRDLICNVGNLGLFGASEWLTATYRVNSALTPAVGEATVTSDQIDPDPSNHVLRLTNRIQ